MKSSGIFNCTVRVKKEPSDGFFTEDDAIIDDKPDTKKVHLLRFLQKNPRQMLQEHDDNHERGLNEDMEIVFECQDAKPNINLLTVEKFNDYSPNHSWNMKHSDIYETQNIIKTETVREVKQEIIGEVAEESSSNFDCELIVKKNKKRRISKKFNDKHKLESHINLQHNKITRTCDICGKLFTAKSYLKIHIDSVHNDVKHACDICGNKLTTKCSLKLHVKTVHNGFRYECNICEKKYSRSHNLKIHIDSIHNKIIHKCDTCGKTFVREQSLKTHMKAVHNDITHGCDVCGKNFLYKHNLNKHVRSSHIGNAL